MKRLLWILLLIPNICFAQYGSGPFSTTSVVLSGTTLPAGTCSAKTIFIKQNASSGQQIYACISGSWVQQGGAGGGSGTVTTVSVVTADGLAGTVANATTTPAITLSTTVTGLLKGNGTAISAATSATDYAPATTGSSSQLLANNGSGSFSNVSVGSGLSLGGGTLSATGSGSGTVNNSTQYQIAYFPSTGTTVTGDTGVTVDTVGNLYATADVIAAALQSNGSGSGYNQFYNSGKTQYVKITVPSSLGVSYTISYPNTTVAANYIQEFTDTTGDSIWVTAASLGGGSGTVNSATQYQIAYYNSSSNVITGDALVTRDSLGNVQANSFHAIGSGSAIDVGGNGSTAKGKGLCVTSDTVGNCIGYCTAGTWPNCSTCSCI